MLCNVLFSVQPGVDPQQVRLGAYMGDRKVNPHAVSVNVVFLQHSEWRRIFCNIPPVCVSFKCSPNTVKVTLPLYHTTLTLERNTPTHQMDQDLVG